MPCPKNCGSDSASIIHQRRLFFKVKTKKTFFSFSLPKKRMPPDAKFYDSEKRKATRSGEKNPPRTDGAEEYERWKKKIGLSRGIFRRIFFGYVVILRGDVHNLERIFVHRLPCLAERNVLEQFGKPRDLL